MDCFNFWLSVLSFFSLWPQTVKTTCAFSSNGLLESLVVFSGWISPVLRAQWNNVFLAVLSDQ